jgi:DNA modification methylase
VKLGPYELGSNDTPENGIYTGDARRLAKAIPDESVDLVFTDPPWGVDYNYGTEYDDNPDRYIADIITWLVPECKRVLRPGGFAFVYQATKRLQETWALFPDDSRLFASCKNFVQLKNLPVEYAVDFIVFWQKRGSFALQGMAKDWNVANTAVTRNGSRGLGFERLPAPPRPLDAVMNIIEQMSAIGEVVLDMFCGMGTIPLGCYLLGRPYLAFEIDPNTAQLARERVRRTQPPLFVPEPEQTGMDI